MNEYIEIEKRKHLSMLYNTRKHELLSVSDSARWLKKGNIRPRNEAVSCYMQDRIVFQGADGMCQHCNKIGKTIDHLATHYEKKARPDIFILDKRKNKVTFIEFRKYDLFANELGLVYKCSARFFIYVMTWDGIVTKYQKKYEYIQSILLKKTVETISFDRRRGLESLPNAEESWKRASSSFILEARMHKQSTPPLKQADNEEDDVKMENTKNILPFILDGITTAEQPTTNTNEELELEEG
ncbi:hypothetical protein CWI38_0058p0030 [Hamiltosporidium tvaerminnensis]|uniref:Uncharacterized protein n=1 Tax=Hamiltosporidium tvaerminnensis TaxID=1176355 RepID=A0A4Q9M2V4_9MICR|nr:hypothetical protein CWI38_0058p0030 [Hamiltosporidium tvaerminnensis]